MGDLENSGGGRGGLRLDDRSPPSFLPLQTLGVRFHHVGVVVTSIEEALDHYVGLLGFERVGPSLEIVTEKIRVCFVRAEPGVLFGLIERVGDRSLVDVILGFPGQGSTYICYQVDDLEGAVATLCEREFSVLRRYEMLIHGMRFFALLSAPDGQLLGLCESESGEEISS